MKPILIGSRALARFNPELKITPSTDWDVISDSPIPGTEWHNPGFLNNWKLTQYSTYETVSLPDGSNAYILSPIGQLIVKRSHLHRDLSFEKHITHYHKYLARLKPMLMNSSKRLLEERIRLTLEAFPQNKPNLNQSVKDFFDDAVVKKYKHDYLHELFAYHDKPLYTRLQRDTSKAWCNEDLWSSLSYNDKVKCVAEECYVIATERFLVPNDWNYIYIKAFNRALTKVCTTLTSGYFRDFAIEEWPRILGTFDKNKIKRVKDILLKEKE